MTEQQTKIGLIGAGLMGSGIAASLLRNGFPLTVLEHPGNQPLDNLLKAGAKTSQRAADLAAQVDILILCVTGSPQVEEILFQKDGVLEGLKQGITVIDCSTAIPSSTLRIAAAVQKAGGRFLDAPMTRTPKEAAEGKLNLIVGGDRKVFEECLPVLQSYSENIAYAGNVGAGHQMKLLHNYVSLGFSAVLAEAAACAREAGTDPKTFCDILAAGGGGGVVLNRLRPYIESEDSSGFRFSMSNALKDMGYYCTMTEEQDTQGSVAQAIKELYAQAANAGLEQSPVPTLIDHLANAHKNHDT
ncbi:NAD(P)-dependent oxidoreductase [Pollutimonas harenae]|uniref:NAD(P)-dependent oxidoreductase n=1 Tax=Pollutimonas harenae TaxID=657015 RepID=A0A853H1V0_9BURK|nr:NAD(P)-dependent oxidoreductase [Pollutimonas harenae]NYT84134.1 NAD(P)-dependent oxidoreductase [Pollutimonas harenae]TEA73449.1 NAD(P)-dependent oxidoreductase [Pollutimonas harenae]